MTTDDTPDARITRRALLVGLLAGAGACTVRRLDPDVSSSPATRRTAQPPPRSSSPPGSAAPSDPPAFGAPFEPHPDDVYPNAKRLAGRFAQSLATYDVGTGPRRVVREAVRKRARAGGFDVAAVSRTARPLIIEGASSTADVVYAQLGGLAPQYDPRTACVMVVLRQRLQTDDGTSEVVRCLDVRLANAANEWKLSSLEDAGGDPVERPRDLPEIATRVLDDGRVDLPDSARWDIHSGIVDERLLRAMAAVAEDFSYSVTTLKTGHPVNVFGTDLRSGHTDGRGCDVWAVDGEPVFSHRPEIVGGGRSERTPSFRFTRRLLKALDVPELGSPWDLDGPPVVGELRPSFTDPVHDDHVHIAFKAKR